ncbi:MAG: hypothetical protein JWO30_4140 [Fibrobacteres bacterium]|nr:hypothetical protein [Fibrobacterota bacterium]
MRVSGSLPLQEKTVGFGSILDLTKIVSVSATTLSDPVNGKTLVNYFERHGFADGLIANFPSLKRGGEYGHVSMLVTPSNGVQWTVRAADGGTTDHPHALNVLKAPIYLRIVKTGTSYVGSYSANGTSWTQLWSAVSMSTPGTYYCGLAATSFTSGLNTLQFSSLTF